MFIAYSVYQARISGFETGWSGASPLHNLNWTRAWGSVSLKRGLIYIEYLVKVHVGMMNFSGQ